jgi:ribonucleoside-diphosphate reductase alpha chain
MAQSIMDYIFRRLALDYLPFETRSAIGIYTAEERQRQLETGSYLPNDDETEVDQGSVETSRPVEQSRTVEPVETAGNRTVEPVETARQAPAGAHTSAELMEAITGTAVDSPLCFTCGTKMRPAGSCFVCEGCGSTSGCS